MNNKRIVTIAFDIEKYLDFLKSVELDLQEDFKILSDCGDRLINLGWQLLVNNEIMQMIVHKDHIEMLDIIDNAFKEVK